MVDMKNLITFILYISFLALLLLCGTIVLALYPETIILKIIVSAINKLILWLRSIVKNKKYNQDNKSDDMEEK